MAAFIGTHDCKVDSKGRISVPAAFRRFAGAEGGETFVVTRSLDPCLTLFAPDGWREFQARLSALTPGPEKRDAIRYFSQNSATLVLDKQGRLGIPREFMADYGIEGEARLVGALDKIEIWRPDKFDAQLEKAPKALGDFEHLF